MKKEKRIYKNIIKLFVFLLFFVLVFFQTAFSKTIAAPQLVTLESFDNLTQATLENIRICSYPEKIRVVFDFNGLSYFRVETGESTVSFFLSNAKEGEQFKKDIKIKDWAIQNLVVDSYKEGLVVKIGLRYPVLYKVLCLAHPSRLVVDFNRSFTQIKKTKLALDGMTFYGIVKGNGVNYVTAQVLEIDPQKIDIFPALSKPVKEQENILQSVVKFFTPWAKEKRPGFYKARVSTIVKQNSAVAGVNGTYFATSGMPLGVLMIDGALVSYPISDRTALIITKERNVYIDNIIMDAYFQIGDVKYTITGINEPRDSKNDIILYTSYYGELTKTNSTGLDIVVDNGVVSSTRSGNTWIPENGFVIAAGALYAEVLSSSIKEGNEIKVVVNVIPYSTQIQGCLYQLIGGGPRLLKSGRIYISKYEEKFRRDITKGRAARTAVGITGDNKLLFVTIDGRKKKTKNGSLGMSLTELAYFLKSLGAEEALNLDGGGSSTMVVHGKVINKPADGAQRRISNAILFKPAK